MYYQTLLAKDNNITREFLMKTFLMLEKEIAHEPSDTKIISLHCKYDLNIEEEKYKFYHEDIYIYFVCGKITDNIQSWLKDYNFVSVDNLPKDLKHMLGIYGSTTIGLNNFIP